MADFPLKHSGVTARFVTSSKVESVPTPISKVPYCIIGTSERGPAFVPFSFADKDTFDKFFSETGGAHEAVVLAKELIEKEQPVTFVRVLGAGDTNPTLGNGRVSKAGFIVGENQLQTSVTDSYIENQNADVDTRSIVVNRSLGSNPFAYEPEDNLDASNSHGRTYFLGCFHKIGNCPVLSKSEINDSEGSAPILRAVIMAASGVSLSLSSSLTPNNEPADKGITGKFGSLNHDAGLPFGDIELKNSRQDFTLFQNGHKEKKVFQNLSFSSSNDNYFVNVLNRDPYKLEEEGHYLYTFYEDKSFASFHNRELETGITNLPQKINSIAPDENFGDTANQVNGDPPVNGALAAFCVRTDSGIGKPSRATLSINTTVFNPEKSFTITVPEGKYSSVEPAVPNANKTITVIIKAAAVSEQIAENTVEISTIGLVLNNVETGAPLIAERIVKALNGIDETVVVNNAEVDVSGSNIEESITNKVNGQLIKGLTAVRSEDKVIIRSIRNGIIDNDFIISSDSNDLLAVDFSGGVDNLAGSSGTQSFEEVLNDGTKVKRLGIPNFENFRTRYSNARTPYFKSQKVFGREYDLFKIHSVSDGEQDFLNPPVVTVTNIDFAKIEYDLNGVKFNDIDYDKHGTFGLEISGLGLEEPIVFHTCSLNPSSDDFISKKIGDVHVFHNFESSERTVVNGKYSAVTSDAFGRFRVEVHPDVERGEIPAVCLPFGFRGMPHLITAGKTGSNNSDGIFYFDNIEIEENVNLAANLEAIENLKVALTRLKEPPFPLRISKVHNATTENWGAVPKFHTGGSFCKFFPSFNVNIQNAWAVDNQNRDKLGGEEINCDAFNNNSFSLEKIAIPLPPVAEGEPINESIVKSNIEAHYFEADVDDMPDVDDAIDLWWNACHYTRDGIAPVNMINPKPDGDRGIFIQVPARLLEPKDFILQEIRAGASFSCMMFGGFNGLNIFDKQKYLQTNRALNDEQVEPTNDSIKDGVTFSAYKEALNVISDRSTSDFDMLIIPGISNPQLSFEALNAAEERFDTVYISNIEKLDSSNNIFDEVTSGSIQSFQNTRGTNTVHLKINGVPQYVDINAEDPVAIMVEEEIIPVDKRKISLFSSSVSIEKFKSSFIDSSFSSTFFPGVKIQTTDQPDGPKVKISAASAAAITIANSQKLVGKGVSPIGTTNGSLSVTNEKLQSFEGDLEKKRFSDAGINIFDYQDADCYLTEAKTQVKDIFNSFRTTDRKTRAQIKTSSYYFLAHRRAMIHVRRLVRNICLFTLFEENNRDRMESLVSFRITGVLNSLISEGVIDNFTVQIPRPNDLIRASMIDVATSDPLKYRRNGKAITGLVTVRLKLSDIDEEIEINVDEENQES